MIDIENLKPFPKFCYTIGMIPSSYKMSLTYEEQLIWFCDFLQNTVIPTVNNNGLAVEELQNLYVQLKDYVDNYFENLDIQTEINNKLDDMAESGDLADIIAVYIQMNTVLGFQTLSNMQDSEYLVNGSICKTLSNEEIGDNKGRYYLIRELTNEDVIDGINIVALNTSNELIAQLINDDRFQEILDTVNTTIGDLTNLDTSVQTDIVSAINEVNSNIGDLTDLDTTSKTNTVSAINEVNSNIGDLTDLDTSSKTNTVSAINELNTNINTINTNLATKQDILTELVIFGDSWSDPTSLDAIWGDIAGNQLNLNVDNYALSGANMTGSTSTSLETQVETFYNDTTVDKDKVKFIVILGGINDYRNAVAWNTLSTKLVEQIELLKTYSPNAKIIYVSNCQWYYDKVQGDYWCGVHEDVRAGSQIVTYNMFGTFGKELFNSNNYFHLTQTGQKIMCSNIIASLTGGEIQYFEDTVTVDNTNGTLKYSSERVGNTVLLHIKLTPKSATTYYSFSNPSGYYFNYYTSRFGVVGRAKEVGIINIAYNAISFDFASNLTANEDYYFTYMVYLNHT